MSSWQQIAAKKRKDLADQIPDEWRIDSLQKEDHIRDVTDIPATCGLLSDEEIRIIECDLEGLLARLRIGNWSAVEVLTAFGKCAAIAQQCTNCLSDFFLDEAMQRAVELDTILKETGKPVGPLHGLPFSVKDIFDIANHDTTAGVVSWIGKTPLETAPIVQCMIAAGGIPFVKTNISQGCRLVESQNNIFGTVKNPHNTTLSAGGSSGGEGALVAMKGTPLGLGTDGGGSIRIPAAWNGVYGLKPSAQRFPKYGVRSPGLSDSNPGSAIGPLAIDLSRLRLWCETILSTEPWLQDRDCLPIPWRDVTAPQRLKVGMLINDGVVNPSPPVQRVLKEAAEKLNTAGHDVVELDWSALHYKGSCIIMKMYTEDGGIAMEEALNASGEPVVPRTCTGSSERLLEPKEIWENKRAGKAFSREYLSTWNEEGIDVLLTAPSPHPAPPHGKYV